MEKPIVIVRDECWELLASEDVKTTLEAKAKAEAADNGIGKEEVLDGLVRQNRQGRPPLPFTG